MKLTDKIETQFRLNLIQKKALTKLKLDTIQDLLFYFPSHYTEISQIRQINSLKDEETVTVLGTISKLKTTKSFKSKIPMSRAIISDLSGSLNIVWFHQPYLAKMIKENSTVKITGKVSNNKTYGLTLTNPEISKSNILPVDLSESLFSKGSKDNNSQFGYPVYSESKGISSKWIYHAIIKILKSDCLKNINDYLPKYIISHYKLPGLYTSLIWIHTPKKKEHADIARKRFAFEEVFFIQLIRQKERFLYQSLPSYKLKISQKDIADFISRFPFNPTKAQIKVIKTILNDFKLDKPMSRLLEGDVGSGKTFVAATISYAIIKNRPLDKDKAKQQSFGNLQVAYMAPTEILAKQHFQSFIEYFKHLPINIGLITGSGCKKFPSKVSASWRTGDGSTNISRAQLLKWVANGEISILIGTHALIQKTVLFKNLAYVIIDEQHRFGTKQRMELVLKDNIAPHLLSMTATPIPRTLALTIYGDLDLTLIDQMPSGRKQIITEIVLPTQRDGVYEKIHNELKNGRQVYVICPRIEEPDPNKALALNVKSVKAEASRLKKEIFPKYEIDILHSKMKPKEKEETMQEFVEGKINILVATSVVEVGVNVPNATVIIIEGAERFGLAQLHQLRGRVLRSNHQAYCYLFADTKNKKSTERLKALKGAKNGFELAELDLTLRGAGELSGAKQWGISDLGMEAIKNIKMVEAAREEARCLILEDPAFLCNDAIVKYLDRSKVKFHFE